MKLAKSTISYHDVEYPTIEVTIDDNDTQGEGFYPADTVLTFADDTLWNELCKGGIEDSYPSDKEGENIDMQLHAYLADNTCEKYADGEITDDEALAAIDEVGI